MQPDLFNRLLEPIRPARPGQAESKGSTRVEVDSLHRERNPERWTRSYEPGNREGPDDIQSIACGRTVESDSLDDRNEGSRGSRVRSNGKDHVPYRVRPRGKGRDIGEISVEREEGVGGPALDQGGIALPWTRGQRLTSNRPLVRATAYDEGSSVGGDTGRVLDRQRDPSRTCCLRNRRRKRAGELCRGHKGRRQRLAIRNHA